MHVPPVDDQPAPAIGIVECRAHRAGLAIGERRHRVEEVREAGDAVAQRGFDLVEGRVGVACGDHHAGVRFDLRTPGRESEDAAVAVQAVNADDRVVADGYIRALGGAMNLKSVDACTTRLRLELADRDRVGIEGLKRLGARGSVRVGDAGLQVVVGPMADQVASAIRSRLHEPGAGGAGGPDVAQVLATLGGNANVHKVEHAAGRLLVTVKDAAKIDQERLQSLGARGVALASASSVHVLHEDAPRLERELTPLLA